MKRKALLGAVLLFLLGVVAGSSLGFARAEQEMISSKRPPTKHSVFRGHLRPRPQASQRAGVSALAASPSQKRPLQRMVSRPANIVVSGNPSYFQVISIAKKW